MAKEVDLYEFYRNQHCFGKKRYARALEWLKRWADNAKGEMLFYIHQISVFHAIRGDHESARRVLVDCIDSGLVDAQMGVWYGRLLLDCVEDAELAQTELAKAVRDPTLES